MKFIKVYRWLERNDFYDVSPILGLELINRAKTYTEKFLWYISILGFFSLTIYNVRIAIEYYWSAPVVTDISVASSTANSSITNFTIKLQLPISELDQTGFDNLLDFDIYQVEWDLSIVAMFYDDVEKFAANFPKVWCHVIYEHQLTTEFQRKTLSVLKLINQFNSSGTLTLPNGTLTWKGYLKQMTKYKSLLKNELSKLLPDGGESLQENFLQQQLNRFRMITKSMQLESSWHQFIQAMNILRHSGKHTGSESSQTSMSDIVSTVHNWPVIQVLSNVGDVHIRNWTIDSTIQTYHLQITVPYGTREIKLAVYSNQLIQLFSYLTVFNERLKELVQKSIDQPENTGYSLCLMNWTPNVTTVLMKQLLKHYEKAAMYLEMEGGSIHLKPFTNNTISLRPVAHLLSEIKNCSAINMQSCIDQCEVQYFIEKCGCHPWHLFYLTKDLKQICQKWCPRNPNVDCSAACESWLQHSCDSSMYAVEMRHEELIPIHANHVLRNDSLFDAYAESALTIEPNTPLIAIHIQIPMVGIHAVYKERYSMGFGKLMAQIGGHFEFFLGINVVALLHLVVHMVQTLYATAARQASIHDRIKILKERLDKLSMLAKAGSKKKGLRKRLNILRRNDWYTSTPFTGWQFINDANSGKVAMIWALLLLIFFGLTVQAVVSTLTEYTSKPIRTTVSMASRVRRNAAFDNFSIVMDISLFEYLLSELNETVEFEILTEMHPMRCIEPSSSVTPPLSFELLYMNINYNIYEHFVKDMTGNQNSLATFWDGINLTEDYWSWYETWYKNMSKPLKNQLDTFVQAMAEDYGYMFTLKKHMAMSEFIYDSVVEMRQKYQYIWRNIFLALHLMECFKLGVDPRWKANNDYLIENGPPNPFDKYAEAKTLMEKFAIDPAVLLNTLLKYLTPQIYSQNAQVLLVDAKNNLKKYSQQLTFQIIPHEDSEQIGFQVYHYSLSRHLLVWQAIAEYMAQRLDINKAVSGYYCDPGQGIKGLGRHFLYQFMFMHNLKELLGHISLNDMIKIQLPSSSISLQPFTSSTINLIPTATYISQTEG